MRYDSSAAFRQALEQRLRDQAKASGGSVVRLRKLVAFDRLLARLGSVAPGRWVLKGALALGFRVPDRGRTTKDMDLVGSGGEVQATEDLIAAQRVDLGDFFVFAVERVSGADETEDVAVRYRARAELAGRIFEEVLVDVGFSDPLRWEPEVVRGPELLGFAGIEPIEVGVLPVEQQVAEKVHAYTRMYGSGEPSSRVKDLVDLLVVTESMAVDARRLRIALEQVFEQRATHELPEVFPRPPGAWRLPFRKLAEEVGTVREIGVGHGIVVRFLDPVLTGRRTGQWDPVACRWS